jgi:hypothetical protein
MDGVIHPEEKSHKGTLERHIADLIKQSNDSEFPLPGSHISPVDSAFMRESSSSSSASSPGKRSRTFKCIKLLGKGGCAEVYLARDNETFRFVRSLTRPSSPHRSDFAMKTCRQPEHQATLDNEIDVLRSLPSHRNLIKYIRGCVSFPLETPMMI